MAIKKILVIFGTRPEAIKMCPLVNELKRRDNFETYVCVTGQHREMLAQVLEAFKVVPDFDLSVMKDKQSLFDISSSILLGIGDVLTEVDPDLVLVHGDTTTTYISALASFYKHIPVGHVEAGLRTFNLQSPFPEEFNRQSVGIIADHHFAPTELAKENLLKEGKRESSIYVTGNTGIDALKTTVTTDFHHEYLEWSKGFRLILITAHRRENLGSRMKAMFTAINRIIQEYSDIKVLYPIHMNPQVRETANSVFEDTHRLKIVEPLEVVEFHNLMANSYLILTDSGGIQEEAPSLGVPVLVMRDTTERPEGTAAGTLKLVGTEENTIYKAFKNLLEDRELYQQMSRANNPYGDGTASLQITDIIESL